MLPLRSPAGYCHYYNSCYRHSCPQLLCRCVSLLPSPTRLLPSCCRWRENFSTTPTFPPPRCAPFHTRWLADPPLAARGRTRYSSAPTVTPADIQRLFRHSVAIPTTLAAATHSRIRSSSWTRFPRPFTLLCAAALQLHCTALHPTTECRTALSCCTAVPRTGLESSTVSAGPTIRWSPLYAGPHYSRLS